MFGILFGEGRLRGLDGDVRPVHPIGVGGTVGSPRAFDAWLPVRGRMLERLVVRVLGGARFGATSDCEVQARRRAQVS